MKKVNFVLALVLMCVSFVLTGCWDQVELNEIFIVVGMAIDKAEQDEFELSLQIIKTQSSAGGSSQNQSTGSGDSSILISEKGKTALEAITALNFDSSRNLIFQHCRILLISTDIASENMVNFLDFFLREEQIRLEIIMILVEGKASEVLKVEPDQEPTTSKYIFNIVTDASKNTPVFKVRLIDFLNNYLSKSSCGVLPLIKKEKQEEKEKIKFFATGFIKDGKLVEVIENKDLFGFFIVIDKITDAVMMAQTEDGIVDYYVLDSKSKKKSSLDKDNNFFVTLEIDAKFKIGEIVGFESHLDYLDFAKEEKQIAENQLEKEISSCFNRLAVKGIDVYNFASKIYRKNPKKWMEIEKDWENIFKNTNLKIKLNIEILSTGQATETVIMEKKNEN